LADGLVKAAEEAACPIRLNRVASMPGLFFTEAYVTNYRSAKSTDTQRYSAFFNSMLKHGIYLPPSAFETIFVSAAHSTADISKTIQATQQAFRTPNNELRRISH